MPFYYIILEQYYTNILNAPIVNGPDEGTFVYVGICIWSGIAGNVKLWSPTTEFLGDKWSRTDFLIAAL